MKDPDMTKLAERIEEGVYVDNADKHKAVFDRIYKLRPIPVDDTCPSTVEILRQVREEEAR